MPEIITSSKTAALFGDFYVPGDKSISHRALIFSAISIKRVKINNLLLSDDVLATMGALRSLGIHIELNSAQGNCSVEGVGLHGLKKPSAILNMGNSGTSMRLLTGLLSAQSFESICIGDSSLSNRPMGRVIDPLSLMGASISGVEKEGKITPPLHIQAASRLQGVKYRLPVASAQVATAILLAGLYAEGTSEVSSLGGARDHTLRMLSWFHYPFFEWQGDSVKIKGGGSLCANELSIPGDFSSASFFIVATVITPDSEVVFRRVGMNPGRIGLMAILKLMGADIVLFNEQQICGEPVADIQVKYSKHLKGVNVPVAMVASMIDELPVLMVAATCAAGCTRIKGAAELRFKESDRIHAMVTGLMKLGVCVHEYPDGVLIEGGRPLKGGQVNSFGDHRIAMALLMLGGVTQREVTVRNCTSIATSFPDFLAFSQQMGLNIY